MPYTANAQFDNRNFELEYRSLEPSLAFIRAPISDFCRLQNVSKKNLLAFGGEQSTTNSLLMESSFCKLPKQFTDGEGPAIARSATGRKPVRYLQRSAISCWMV